MSPDNITDIPATPRHTTPMQALSGLFRTPTRLRTPATVSRGNKRTRARTSSLSSSAPSTPITASLPAVVLQTYSVSTDSIVLTALSSAPFCCHEDLLTMSRAQLEGVIRALNARLPRRMRIGPEGDFWQNDDRDHAGECDGDDDGLSRLSEAEMRRRIEELVGIRIVVGKSRVSRSGLGLGTRGRVPSAPKAIRTRDAAWKPCERTPWEMEVSTTEDHSDDLSIVSEDALMGSSPLASRTTYGSHVRGRSTILPSLAILEEENEGSRSSGDDFEVNEARPPKRQRMSSGSLTQDSDGGFQTVWEVTESRLIENMDLSGSPLMAKDGVSSEDFTECNESVATATTTHDHATKSPEETAKTPPQRRRSDRIKEIALRRTSSVNMGRKTVSMARDLKSSVLRSKTFSRRLSRNIPMFTEGSNPRDSGAPKELTIRLPFTSTPPHQKRSSSAWSAPRILRSHSQRLLNSSESTKTKASLGRSQSERYPRASDLAFVTINRPRYRFTRRGSNSAKITKGDQVFHLSSTSLSEHDAGQPQRDEQIGTEHSNGRYDHKENEDPKVPAGSSVMNLYTLPSVSCSLLAPRSRAPSTSTIASTRGNCGESPIRTTAQTAITESVVGDGATDRVWEALGRMAVNSA